MPRLHAERGDKSFDIVPINEGVAIEYEEFIYDYKGDKVDFRVERVHFTWAELRALKELAKTLGLLNV